MSHPFEQLRGEYSTYLAHMQVTRPLDADQAAKKILRPENLDRYMAAAWHLTVPAVFIGVLDLRESDCDPHLALGQGDPWNTKSTHVPRGFGPFSSWVAAARFYIGYDHLNDNSSSWSMEYACWKGEAWNGFGPRAHGRPTGYLWAGTSIYRGGKYVADGRWDPGESDKQIGIVPVLLRIAQLRPDLAIGSLFTTQDVPPLVPDISPSAAQVGGCADSVSMLQRMLNAVYPYHGTLLVDGSFGRRTRETLRRYQITRNLPPTGLCDHDTLDHLRQEYEKLPEAERESPSTQRS